METWFRVPYKDLLYHTLRGTKPGDLFGDIAFNYVFGRVLRVIRDRLTDFGLAAQVPTATAEMRLDLNAGPEPLREILFLEDLAPFLEFLNLYRMQTGLPEAARIVVDTCAEHGFTVI